MVDRTLISMALVMIAFGCGSSDASHASVCEQACDLIEAACMSTESDCAEQCSEDLAACPDEMNAVLDCVVASELQCDPEQDQGLAEAPCEEEHEAVDICGNDPF